MTLFLSICTVSAIAWIITREQIFAPLRSWAKGKRGLYPLSCAYCLVPYVAAVIAWVCGFGLLQYGAVVWLGYVNIAIFNKVRG